MKKIVSVLTIVVVAPIWYYLMYRLLIAVNATEVMWLLFWVYVPVQFLCRVLAEVSEEKK